jgi:hypothetical protein
MLVADQLSREVGVHRACEVLAGMPARKRRVRRPVRSLSVQQPCRHLR